MVSCRAITGRQYALGAVLAASASVAWGRQTKGGSGRFQQRNRRGQAFLWRPWQRCGVILHRSWRGMISVADKAVIGCRRMRVRCWCNLGLEMPFRIEPKEFPLSHPLRRPASSPPRAKPPPPPTCCQYDSVAAKNLAPAAEHRRRL